MGVRALSNMASLGDKRAEVLARQRAVGKKISRMNRSTGVQISGTPLDPRVPRERIARLNTVQLDALLNRLNTFQSRKVQYVPDASNRPIPKQKFDQYTRLVRQYNREVRRRQAKYDDVFLKSAGQTVKERRAMRTPVHRAGTNPAANSPVELSESKPWHIASPKALDRLIKSMKEKTAPSYHKKRIKEARDQLKKMAYSANIPSLFDNTSGLTDAQFDFLWNETSYATAASLAYELTMSSLSNTEKPWFSTVINDKLNDSLAQIEDARNIT